MTGQGRLVDQAAELFEQFRDGQREKIEPLVGLLNPLLWHVARSCNLQRPDAEDIVQTAWLLLVDHAENIREPKAVVAWLGTTVRREAWKISRMERKSQSWDDQDTGCEPADPGVGPVDLLLQDETQRMLWDHVSRLSPRCQQILRVISRGGAPDYAALSEILGIPIGSIGPTRGRCLAALRNSLSTDAHWSAK
ncbi:sigma-70 family RNA polymerase sigma factor [Glutamicibacter sp. MNS18]|uniref:RNA polymerase sigma factor n=1 Tax=Glutamicibacter sp. MNS18 TaxID=2989817 RepID=UPI00223630D5|nr:sigma-70 family RNA polymerase sigma factor [Glutamicibacter sp. MNS18]MCW4464573.1 sigma-70 family RNA polymerase sigma factor [Glutamicibacter sp. MNS18]